ncbi:MAG: hypothetical protein L0216_11695 [Planctomycetales bacterium]|nr:hypothetical protein [Planctomycetales bacterium]
MDSPLPERRRAALEFAAVIATGIVHLAVEGTIPGAKPYFIGACVVAWGGYVARRVVADRTVLRDWGLRLDNLRRASLVFAPVLVLGVAILLGYRLALGFLPLPATAPLLFALYPFWGLLQQFLLQGLVAGNLERLGLPRPALVAVAAALFGLVHLPDWPMVALTAVAGAFWVPLFLLTRNLFPLAIVHGWLGGLAYYWVVVRDPWKEMFPA